MGLMQAFCFGANGFVPEKFEGVEDPERQVATPRRIGVKENDFIFVQ